MNHLLISVLYSAYSFIPFFISIKYHNQGKDMPTWLVILMLINLLSSLIILIYIIVNYTDMFRGYFH